MGARQLVVFDLDYTLWDAGGTWCDCLAPPFRVRGGRVFDSGEREIRLYPDVRGILETLLSSGHSMAVASRTGEPEWARELMQGLEIDSLFDHQEIYPGSKVAHFKSIAAASGRSYQQMLFFDDEQRNIDEVNALGVKAVLVRRGINRRLVEQHLHGEQD